MVKRLDGYDVVIAGAGPSGCVLAKGLAKEGKKVIVIEQGGDSRALIGSPLGFYFFDHMEKAKFPNMFDRTLEGEQVAVGKGVGGGTYCYGGIASMPNLGEFDKVGIDLRPYLEEAKKESWVSDTPDSWIGPTTRRMQEAAHEVGIPLEPCPRHVKFDKCEYGCPKPMYGCPRDAKWTGRYALEDAKAYGAEVMLRTMVNDIIIENGKAVGFNAMGTKNKQEYEIRGKTVVCSAGGKGTAHILMKSGITKAGTKVFGDPCLASFGTLPKGVKGMGDEHGSSVAYVDDDKGILFASYVTSTRLLWGAQVFLSEGLRGFWNAWKDYPRVAWIYFKIHDEGEGRITWDREIAKPLTPSDHEKLNYSKYIDEQILRKMGCPASSIGHTITVYGHPGGTCAIGKIVDKNLESPIKNCYVCDVSAMPGAPARPPVLTLVCLAKYFEKILLKKI